MFVPQEVLWPSTYTEAGHELGWTFSIRPQVNFFSEIVSHGEKDYNATKVKYLQSVKNNIFINIRERRGGSSRQYLSWMHACKWYHFIPWKTLHSIFHCKIESFVLLILFWCIPINTFLHLSQARPQISNTICYGLFYVQWVEVGGDCSFLWYWWTIWLSLFKLSFHKYLIAYINTINLFLFFTILCILPP